MKKINILSSILILFAAVHLSAQSSTTADNSGIGLDLLALPSHLQFSLGQEYPGAAGSFTLTPDNDKNIAVISYDFTHGGAYVSLRVVGDVSGQYNEISFSAMDDVPANIGIAIVDSGDQHFQATPMAYTTVGDWKAYRLTLKEITASGNNFGGANDGVFRPPIKEIALTVSAATGAPKGKISFKDVFLSQ